MLPTNKGAHFEKLACQYLRKQGYHEITCNYRCRFGEIDLVMGNRDQLALSRSNTGVMAAGVTP